jgi:hypothetical protein
MSGREVARAGLVTADLGGALVGIAPFFVDPVARAGMLEEQEVFVLGRDAMLGYHVTFDQAATRLRFTPRD